MYEIKCAKRLSHALVHFVTPRASLFTDHKISGLPIRAKYRHFKTICGQTFDNSPTDFNSSSLKWWSSMHGVATLFYCWVILFANSKYLSTHFFAVDRTLTHNTHLCSTVCSQARNAHHALGSSHQGLHFIFVRLKRICRLVLHMSRPLLFSHLPFNTSTSSSSFTLPSTTTQEHAAQPVQHEQLREHPVHHPHLQALPVDKLRHQESLWRENPAHWRKPAHDNSNRWWAQRASDCLKNRCLFWRSISIICCTGKCWRTRSPSSDHRRSEGIWRNWDSRLTGF